MSSWQLNSPLAYLSHCLSLSSYLSVCPPLQPSGLLLMLVALVVGWGTWSSVRLNWSGLIYQYYDEQRSLCSHDDVIISVKIFWHHCCIKQALAVDHLSKFYEKLLYDSRKKNVKLADVALPFLRQISPKLVKVLLVIVLLYSHLVCHNAVFGLLHLY